MKKMKQKIHSQAGESISETLVSLLVAALALVMLAGAISAASDVIVVSRDKLDRYNSANQEKTGVIKMESGGRSGSITIKDLSHSISEQSYSVTYYKNNEFDGRTVVAYKHSPPPAGGGGGG
jgi:hypothetical protein